MADGVIVKIIARNLTKRGVKDAEKTIKQLNRAVDQMAFRMKVAGAAAVGLGVMAVREFANFDRKVREIGTLLGGLTQDQIKEMGNEIRHTAIEFGQSFDAMAKARYDIVSAGFTKASDSAIMLRESAKLAVAGVAEVSQTADVLTNVLNAYGRSAKEAEHFSDVLFTTVRLGKTTIPELASGLGRVIAIAPQAGVSFEELSAAVATLTSVGQSTDEVVTALNAALNGFINTSPTMEKRLKALGYESGAAAIEALGFAGALKAVTEGANIVELQEMFGNIRAFRAVAPLAGKAAQKFADNLKQMADTAGATQQAVEQMMDSPAMRLDRLRQRFKSAMIDIGEALDPLVAGLEKASEKFSELDTLSKTVVISLAGFVALLKFASPIITAFGSSMGSVLMTFGKFAGPIAIVVGSIAVLAKAYRDAKEEADDLIEKQKEITRVWQVGVPELVKELDQLKDSLSKTNDVGKQMELGQRITKLQKTITQRLEEAEDSSEAFKKTFVLSLEDYGIAADDAAGKTQSFFEKLQSMPDVDWTKVYESLQEQIDKLQEKKVELVASLTVQPDDTEMQAELESVMQLLSKSQQQVSELGVRLYPEWAADSDQMLAEISNQFFEDEFENLQNNLNESYENGLLERQQKLMESAEWEKQLLQEKAEAFKTIYSENLSFQLWMIDMQAKKYKELTRDEVQARRWAEQQKTQLVLRHMQQRNVIWQSASAAYDTFINTLINKEMTGKERRERMWEAAKNAFIRFVGSMLKQYIANLIAQQIVTKAHETAAIASAKMTGMAIAQAYAAAAEFASVATFGAAAVAGTSALMTGLGIARAAATFQQGGIVEDRDRGEFILMQPQGTDTVPAMLTPGEAVIPQDSVQRNPLVVEHLIRGEDVEAGNTVQINVAPQFTVNAVDSQGIRDFVRSEEFAEELAEAINDSIIRLKISGDEVKGII